MVYQHLLYLLSLWTYIDIWSLESMDFDYPKEMEVWDWKSKSLCRLPQIAVDSYSQNLLRLLRLLMLVMRIVLATVCCRFGSWGWVIKLNFCSDFEHFGQDFDVEVQARFWNWSFFSILLLMFGWGYQVGSGQDFKFKFSRDTEVWLIFIGPESDH